MDDIAAMNAAPHTKFFMGLVLFLLGPGRGSYTAVQTMKRIVLHGELVSISCCFSALKPEI
jgi:hypothetical protein